MEAAWAYTRAKHVATLHVKHQNYVPYYLVIDMKSFRILCALYAKFRMMQCCICKVSISCSALYAKCPYYVVFCM